LAAEQHSGDRHALLAGSASKGCTSSYIGDDETGPAAETQIERGCIKMAPALDLDLDQSAAPDRLPPVGGEAGLA
jgi:hypothetical protein